MLPPEIIWSIGRYLPPADLINYLTAVTSQPDLTPYTKVLTAQFVPLQNSTDILVQHRDINLLFIKIDLESDHIDDRQCIPLFFDEDWQGRNEFRADLVKASLVNNVLHGPIEFYRGGTGGGGTATKVAQGHYFNGLKSGPWILSLPSRRVRPRYEAMALYRESGHYLNGLKDGAWSLQQRVNLTYVDENGTVTTQLQNQLRAEVNYQAGLKQGPCQTSITKLVKTAMGWLPARFGTEPSGDRTQGQFLNDYHVGHWLLTDAAGRIHKTDIYSQQGRYIGYVNATGEMHYWGDDLGDPNEASDSDPTDDSDGSMPSLVSDGDEFLDTDDVEDVNDVNEDIEDIDDHLAEITNNLSDLDPDENSDQAHSATLANFQLEASLF